jgi:hypothetical protein
MWGAFLVVGAVDEAGQMSRLCPGEPVSDEALRRMTARKTLRRISWTPSTRLHWTPRDRSQPPAPQPARTSTIPLPPAQRDVLLQALADAVNHRDPPLHCSDCAAVASLCGQCTAGLSRARAYFRLSREFGISP